jgi:hypothetical protein
MRGFIRALSMTDPDTLVMTLSVFELHAKLARGRAQVRLPRARQCQDRLHHARVSRARAIAGGNPYARGQRHVSAFAAAQRQGRPALAEHGREHGRARHDGRGRAGVRAPHDRPVANPADRTSPAGQFTQHPHASAGRIADGDVCESCTSRTVQARRVRWEATTCLRTQMGRLRIYHIHTCSPWPCRGVTCMPSLFLTFFCRMEHQASSFKLVPEVTLTL